MDSFKIIYNNKIKKNMKGDVSPIIYVLIAIAAAIIAIVLLLNRSAIFTSSLSKSDCEAKISEACVKYSGSSSYSGKDISVFNNIPAVCEKFFPDLSKCKSGNEANECESLCENR